jgi:hypothetical protein
MKPKSSVDKRKSAYRPKEREPKSPIDHRLKGAPKKGNNE